MQATARALKDLGKWEKTRRTMGTRLLEDSPSFRSSKWYENRWVRAKASLDPPTRPSSGSNSFTRLSSKGGWYPLSLVSKGSWRAHSKPEAAGVGILVLYHLHNIYIYIHTICFGGHLPMRLSNWIASSKKWVAARPHPRTSVFPYLQVLIGSLQSGWSLLWFNQE